MNINRVKTDKQTYDYEPKLKPPRIILIRCINNYIVYDTSRIVAPSDGMCI